MSSRDASVVLSFDSVRISYRIAKNRSSTVTTHKARMVICNSVNNDKTQRQWMTEGDRVSGIDTAIYRRQLPMESRSIQQQRPLIVPCRSCKREAFRELSRRQPHIGATSKSNRGRGFLFQRRQHLHAATDAAAKALHLRTVRSILSF